MLHLYWQNLLCKINLNRTITLLIFLSFYISDASAGIPGILDSLEKLLVNHREHLTRLELEVSKNSKNLEDVKGIQEVKFDPLYLRSVLFFSDWNYLNLTEKGECSVYSLLINNLLKGPKGPISKIAIRYKLSKNDEVFSALVLSQDFANQMFKSSCYSLKQASVLFDNENVQRTLKNLNFQAPKNKTDCQVIFKNWKDNDYLPFLCQINELSNQARIAQNEIQNASETDFEQIKKLRSVIRLNDFYSEKLNPFQKSFLRNLCPNLENYPEFCAPYTDDSIWNKVANGEEPHYKMYHLCTVLFGKQAEAKNIPLCQNKFIKQPDTCLFLGAKTFPSVIPKPSCDQTSLALNLSNLKTDYKDCPGLVTNEAIVNISRIIMHTQDKKDKVDVNKCNLTSTYQFAKMQIDFGNESAWPLKMCYPDKFEGQEVCREYIPGESKDIDIAETNVLSKILYKMLGAPSNLVCKIIEKSKYKPTLLEFKDGCFIVYDPGNCNSQACEKEIIYNRNVIKNIKYIGTPTFEYFPSTFGNAKFSASEVISETLGISHKKINNLTELKVFFNGKKPIVHGIGCIEDIYPHIFSRATMNECRPVPFILDGVTGEGKNAYLSLRTAIDDLHLPRYVLWSYVFNSLSSYQLLHPTKLWALYGIR